MTVPSTGDSRGDSSDIGHTGDVSLQNSFSMYVYCNWSYGVVTEKTGAVWTWIDPVPDCSWKWCAYSWMAGKHVRQDRVWAEWPKTACVGLWHMVLQTTMFVIIDLPAWSVTIMATMTHRICSTNIITQELKYMNLCPWWGNIFNLRQEINDYERLHSTCFPYWNVRENWTL